MNPVSAATSLLLLLLDVLRRRRWWRFEALQQEGGVEDKRHRNGDQSIHEYVQLRLAETVFPQPLEHFVLGQQVAWNGYTSNFHALGL